MKTYITKPRFKPHEYKQLRHFSYQANIIRNKAIQWIEAHYQETGKYIHRYELMRRMRRAEPVYRTINGEMANKVLEGVDRDYQSFFSLMKLKQKGGYEGQVNTPKVGSFNGYNTLTISVHRVTISKGRQFSVPAPTGYYKGRGHLRIRIRVPNHIDVDRIRVVQIVPQFNGEFFHVHYIMRYPKPTQVAQSQHGLGIDLGVNNFATCVSTKGDSFIMDGKYFKSVGRYFSKEWAEIQRMKYKQGHTHVTKREIRLREGYKNRVRDFVFKTVRYVVDYCLENDISLIIMGYNEGFKRNLRFNRRMNQIFAQMPHGYFADHLELLCQEHGITYVEQEESYTSKSSFFDGDPLPIFNPSNPKKYTFSGRRTHRGMYTTQSGYSYNADVNGALNILRKSKLLEPQVKALQNRSRIDRPTRIRLFSSSTNEQPS